MTILKIGVIGVIGALISLQFKHGKTEYSIYISIGISVLVFFAILDKLELFIATLQRVNDFLMIDPSYLTTMLKMVGITYISEFSSGICKDAGYQTIAVQIELFGKLTILALGMPVLLALLETIREFLV